MSRKEAIGRIAARIPKREVIGRTASRAAWELTRFTVRHEIDDPQDYFGDAKDHLADGGGSLIIIVNHFDRLDTTIIGHVIEQNLTTLDRVGGVASLKYIDPARNKLISLVIDHVRQAKGFSIIPVIQDIPEELEHYTKNPEAIAGKSPRRFNLEAMKDAIEWLRKPGSVLMIAPEGTRSPNRKLLKAHEGLDSIMRMSRRNALMFPIALVPPDTRRIVPPYTKVRVIPGQLFSLEDVLQEQEKEAKAPGREKLVPTLTDRMMLRLARLLPPKNQGYYRPFI
ncbi:MAG: 1-acyl-sn-glycerol-3-phosphate acyltransferase [Candidatus Levybacteria bacterium]|nr:1-acyl-sn-glycerol-3-phosphate acyltransferase [Candidatus Levybacteria bacterium]